VVADRSVLNSESESGSEDDDGEYSEDSEGEVGSGLANARRPPPLRAGRAAPGLTNGRPPTEAAPGLTAGAPPDPQFASFLRHQGFRVLKHTRQSKGYSIRARTVKLIDDPAGGGGGALTWLPSRKAAGGNVIPLSAMTDCSIASARADGLRRMVIIVGTDVLLKLELGEGAVAAEFSAGLLGLLDARGRPP